MDEIGEELVSDIDEARFADMCAQTLVYGALTARVIDPVAFGASPVLTTVPLANPLLTSFFEQVHDQVTALDLEAAGLESLVADLRATNVEASLDQFGATSAGGDPVIHFYERFSRNPTSGWRHACTSSSPASSRSVRPSIRAPADDALPVRRWERVQWQYPAASGGSEISKRTPPHRQPPVRQG